ncbi:MAG: hypothetical protein ACPG45_07325 [Flavobacteriaceae bacterium]
MNKLLTYVSYIFHPIFISFIGIGIYYTVSPKYYADNYIENRLFQLLILTIIIPLLIFRVLKKLNIASTLMMEDVKERRYPYMIAVILNFYITIFIFKENTEPELHYFFAGISFTAITFLVLSYFNYKASLHSAAISGLTMFVAALSIHYQSNMVFLIGGLLLCNGLVATSRLHLKAHTAQELLIGFFMGLTPQFILMSYWV